MVQVLSRVFSLLEQGVHQLAETSEGTSSEDINVDDIVLLMWLNQVFVDISKYQHQTCLWKECTHKHMPGMLK